MPSRLGQVVLRFRVRAPRSSGSVASTALLLALGVGCATTPLDIREMADRRDVAGLIALVSDESSWVREGAIDGLGRAGAKHHAGLVDRKLADRGERPYVRVAAARTLGRFGAGASTLAATVAEAGARPELVITAMYALCQASGSGAEAVRTIQPLVEHSDLLVATHASKIVQDRCGRK